MTTTLRPALPSDLDALVDLENRLFQSDRLSRRSLRRFIDHPSDRLIVAVQAETLVGYSLVLMRRATRLARIYSLGVCPSVRGQGVGEALLSASEQVAREAGRIVMRLEVREDNAPAIRLYQRLGYRQFGHHRDYYEDHSDALRFERRILHYHPSAAFPRVPYYPQTTEFTCGPAALMMAMAAVTPDSPLNAREELAIWRQATTIFMLAGHGGCGPHGLALAAWQRGFQACAYISHTGPLFRQTVRNPDKKRVLELVHETFLADLADTDVTLHDRAITLAELEQALRAGQVPLVLISGWQLSGSRVPHWVTVCAVDDSFVYLHDPEVDLESGDTIADKQYLPVDRQLFTRMQQYGREQRLQAAVVVAAREPVQR